MNPTLVTDLAMQVADERLEVIQKALIRLNNTCQARFKTKFDDWFYEKEKGDFRMDGEPGDWVPWFNDDDDEYQQTAYSVSVVRKNGVRSLELRSCDTNGDSDFDCEWTEEDAKRDPKGFSASMWTQSCDRAILAEANYAEWVARGEKDDLGKYTSREAALEDAIGNAQLLMSNKMKARFKADIANASPKPVETCDE